MMHRPILTPVLTAVTLTAIFAAMLLSPQLARTSPRNSNHAEAIEGRKIFASRCADCHGLDGTGTQRAPNIATNPQVQDLSQKELFQIVSAGMPGVGMPAFRSLGTDGINAVTDYIRILQGKSGSARVAGNPQRGEAVFFGKGNCSNCHMAGGRGGFIAPDLTTYGQAHSAEQIRVAITNPGEREALKNMVTAIAVNEEHYECVVRNEDNFSLQLQSLDGVFHLLSKSDLKSIDRGQSLMPADYASRLSDAELDDVVSYLLTLANAAPRASSRHSNRE